MRVRLSVVKGAGLPERLVLDAASVEDARRQADRLGYSVLACQQAGWRWGGALFAGAAASARDVDIAVLVEQLRDLLVAGLSVVEALDALVRGAQGNARALLQRLEVRLREGQTLSAAMASDVLFPPLLSSLVKASELTSDLPRSLTRFLEHHRRVAELRHRIVSTAIYPMLLMGVGSLVLLFLLFYVMPRFARVFEGMTGDLPWSARAMVAWSQLLGAHGSGVLASVLALAVAGAALLMSANVRARMLRRCMAWRPLHKHLHAYFLSRWYRATGMLVEGGIPLSQALQVANDLLPLAMQPSGQAVAAHIHDGLSPSAAHVRAGMATPVAEQLMLAGERTGDLGAVLTRVAHFHETDITRQLERVMRTLEPVVMVLIGLGVGLVVVLMYLPIFELASAIQ